MGVLNRSSLTVVGTPGPSSNVLHDHIRRMARTTGRQVRLGIADHLRDKAQEMPQGGRDLKEKIANRIIRSFLGDLADALSGDDPPKV